VIGVPPVLCLCTAFLTVWPASWAISQEALPSATGNRVHDTLARSSSIERSRIADSYLRSVGFADCDVVRFVFRSYRPGDYASWRADCRDGRRFLVNLADGPGGNAEIMSCSEVESLGDNCFVERVP
jgi:hypothetical protein